MAAEFPQHAVRNGDARVETGRMKCASMALAMVVVVGTVIVVVLLGIRCMLIIIKLCADERMC